MDRSLVKTERIRTCATCGQGFGTMAANRTARPDDGSAIGVLSLAGQADGIRRHGGREHAVAARRPLIGSYAGARAVLLQRDRMRDDAPSAAPTRNRLPQWLIAHLAHNIHARQGVQ